MNRIEGKTILESSRNTPPRFGFSNFQKPTSPNQIAYIEDFGSKRCNHSHLLGEAQGVFLTHLQRVKHEPAAHVRIVRVVGQVRHTFRVLLWLFLTSRTLRRTSQLLRKNTNKSTKHHTCHRWLSYKLSPYTPSFKSAPLFNHLYPLLGLC